MPVRDEGKIRVLEFGTGDISIAPMFKEKDMPCDCVGFVQHVPGEIGRYTKDLYDKIADEVDTRVVMMFDKVDSLVVLIEQLQAIKDNWGKTFEHNVEKGDSLI